MAGEADKAQEEVNVDLEMPSETERVERSTERIEEALDKVDEAEARMAKNKEHPEQAPPPA